MVSKDIEPELRIAIHDEVKKAVQEQTDGDRMFIRGQLTRLSRTARFIGIPLAAVLTLLNLKSCGDLYSVAEKQVAAYIERGEPAKVYRERAEQLLREIQISAALSQALLLRQATLTEDDCKRMEGSRTESWSPQVAAECRVVRREKPLSESEYSSILASLKAGANDSDDLYFMAAVLTLRHAPYPVWQKSALTLSEWLGTADDERNWAQRRPARASVVLNALIESEHSPVIHLIRPLISNKNLEPIVRAKAIELAATVGDLRSLRAVESAYHAAENSSEMLRNAALRYLSKMSPESEIVTEVLRKAEKEVEKGKGAVFKNKGIMRSLQHLCEVARQPVSPTLRRLEGILFAMLENGNIRPPSAYRLEIEPDKFTGTGLGELGVGYWKRNVSNEFGVVAKEGSDEYTWPMDECAQHAISAVARKTWETGVPEKAIVTITEIANKFTVINQGVVQSALLVSLKEPESQSTRFWRISGRAEDVAFEGVADGGTLRETRTASKTSMPAFNSLILVRRREGRLRVISAACFQQGDGASCVPAILTP